MSKTVQNAQEEKVIHPASGLLALFLLCLGLILDTVGLVLLLKDVEGAGALHIISLVALFIVWVIICILFSGLKVVHPNEAMVFTLFGKYHGSVKEAGFFYLNPFVTAIGPQGFLASTGETEEGKTAESKLVIQKKRISLKMLTLNNDKQKINDALGNPIVIGVVVIWRVINTYKALFSVDNYVEFLSIQCDSALRNVVRLYPYDLPGDEKDEMSLRASSSEVASKLTQELQSKVEVAGLEIVDARITNLAYAPEIAVAMLQRQQAGAFVDAKQLIVEGAVGMVEMALDRLKTQGVVDLDEERKATMVSNLLVVLCGNKDVQPVVNSGTLY
jgi:regulator of protease activity HflC (stomatin/prohibitin superfamily)